MAGERPDTGPYAIFAAIDRLRDDVREDLGASEKRVMTAIEDATRTFGGYRDEHGREHVAMRGDSEAAHKRFDAFIASQSVAQARRDGALGVVRFLVELAGANWKAILALGLALYAALGNLEISIGIR